MEPLDTTDASSPDFPADNIAKLRELFPECFTEGSDEDGPRYKVDFETLKETLGEYVEDKGERYSFTWNGKARARRIAQTPSTGTLRPCPEESVNWDTTQNLFIEGDNLEVLKLLQKSYHRRVKMIYIDPPYNTGKEFIYPDKFQDNLDTYLRYTGQIDDAGFKLSPNTDTSGRYHTNWLNMMYPRLRLARNLLSDDGVIYMSIDDTEHANLRKIADEIFGEENFIISICHKSRASVSNDKIVSANHNHVLLYARSHAAIHACRRDFGLDPNLDGFDKTDSRGNYKLVPVDGPGGGAKGNPHYTFLGVTGYFRFSKETMQKMYDDDRIVKVGSGLQQKLYLDDARETRRTTTSWWDEKLYTSSATSALKRLMGGDFFDNPKNRGLIEKMLSLWVRNDGDIVLDFFAGSGTTGHAVWARNAADGVSRRFILVQLPERCSEDTAAAEAGYKTIPQLARERLRRSRAELETEGTDAGKVDLGFRTFKLDSSNIKTWDAGFDRLEESVLESTESVKAERSPDDILNEVLLKFGLDLCVPIEKRIIANATVFSVGAGALVVCLEDSISLDVVEGIAALRHELQPEVMRVVFRDSGFKDDVVKANAVQILKQTGLTDEHIRSV